MAQERFLPAMGTAVTISHYFELIGDLADRAGVATPMLDRAAELYARCIDMGLGEHDNAVMVEVIRRLPRRRAQAKGGKAKPKKVKSVKKADRKRKSRGRKR